MGFFSDLGRSINRLTIDLGRNVGDATASPFRLIKDVSEGNAGKGWKSFTDTAKKNTGTAAYVVSGGYVLEPVWKGIKDNKEVKRATGNLISDAYQGHLNMRNWGRQDISQAEWNATGKNAVRAVATAATVVGVGAVAGGGAAAGSGSGAAAGTAAGTGTGAAAGTAAASGTGWWSAGGVTAAANLLNALKNKNPQAAAGALGVPDAYLPFIPGAPSSTQPSAGQIQLPDYGSATYAGVPVGDSTQISGKAIALGAAAVIGIAYLAAKRKKK